MQLAGADVLYVAWGAGAWRVRDGYSLVRTCKTDASLRAYMARAGYRPQYPSQTGGYWYKKGQ